MTPPEDVLLNLQEAQDLLASALSEIARREAVTTDPADLAVLTMHRTILETHSPVLHPTSGLVVCACLGSGLPCPVAGKA